MLGLGLVYWGLGLGWAGGGVLARGPLLCGLSAHSVRS